MRLTQRFPVHIDSLPGHILHTYDNYLKRLYFNMHLIADDPSFQPIFFPSWYVLPFTSRIVIPWV